MWGCYLYCNSVCLNLSIGSRPTKYSRCGVNLLTSELVDISPRVQFSHTMSTGCNLNVDVRAQRQSSRSSVYRTCSMLIINGSNTGSGSVKSLYPRNSKNIISPMYERAECTLPMYVVFLRNIITQCHQCHCDRCYINCIHHHHYCHEHNWIS